MTGTVQERLFDLVARENGISQASLTRQTRFVEDLGSDSLDMVEFVMAAEEEFEVTIADEDAQNLKSLGDVIDYIERAGAAK